MRDLGGVGLNIKGTVPPVLPFQLFSDLKAMPSPNKQLNKGCEILLEISHSCIVSKVYYVFSTNNRLMPSEK